MHEGVRSNASQKKGREKLSYREPSSRQGLSSGHKGGKNAEDALPPPHTGVLGEYDFTGMEPLRLQKELDKLTNVTTFDRSRDEIADLSETGRLPEVDDACGGTETRDLAQVRRRSMTEGGARLWAQSFDHAQMNLASEYVSMSPQLLGIEPYIAPECVLAAGQTTSITAAYICAPGSDHRLVMRR